MTRVIWDGTIKRLTRRVMTLKSAGALTIEMPRNSKPKPSAAARAARKCGRKKRTARRE